MLADWSMVVIQQLEMHLCFADDEGSVLLPVLCVVIAVQMLLSLDVPSVSRNYNEQTPYELAKNSGHAKCAAAIGNGLDVLL